MRTIPLHMQNRELLDEAKAAFRPSDITPGTPIEKIMFEAGAQKVLAWMDKRLADKSSEGVVAVPTEEAEVPDSREGAMRRLMRGMS